MKQLITGIERTEVKLSCVRFHFEKLKLLNFFLGLPQEPLNLSLILYFIRIPNICSPQRFKMFFSCIKERYHLASNIVYYYLFKIFLHF